MKKEILKGMIISVSFMLTTLVTIIAYGAWINISNQTNGTTINATIWNDLVNNMNTIGAKVDTLANIPTGGVMALNLASCPSGWIPANGTSGTPDLRGEFIRGLDSGRGVDSGRTLGTWQDGSTKLLMNGSVDPVNPGPAPEGNSPNGIIVHKPSVEMIGINTGFWGQYTARYTLRSAMDTNRGGAAETRSRNVALLYCVKQ